MQRYSSNLQKGGAMATESLILLREWDPASTPAAFAERVIGENLVGMYSRGRIRDFLTRIFLRRYPPEVATALHYLLSTGLPESDLRLLMLYHTAQVEGLLYDFVTQYVWQFERSGRTYLDTTDGILFIGRLTETGLIDPPWSPVITRKTAQGLLGACRGFGILEGHLRKRLLHPYISQTTFLYIAYDLKDRGVMPGELLAHPDWKLLLMDELAVERQLMLAHQNGMLRYEAAGGIKRIDWTWPSRDRFVAQVAQGAH